MQNMKINPNPHFSPDKPNECSPASYIVCEHRRNSRTCPNKMSYEKDFISITDKPIQDKPEKIDIFKD